MNKEPCPICKTTADHSLQETSNDADMLHHYGCPQCGSFMTSTFNCRKIEAANEIQKGNLSTWVSQNPYAVINSENINQLLNLLTPSVGEKAFKILQYFSKLKPIPGTALDLYSNKSIFSVASSIDSTEVQYLIDDFLIKAGFLQHTAIGFGKITPQGWEYLEKHESDMPATDQAFVAMSFHPKLYPLWVNGLFEGIRKAGYYPQRIDQKHHNNRIDDEIISEIKKSKFVVADFTRNRGGIYFEAGFALGRNLPVIWTIRKDRENHVHFDNRQYNFIQWEENNLEVFSVALKNRIEAAIGRGNYNLEKI